MSEFREKARQWVDENINLRELISITNNNINEAIREEYLDELDENYIAYIFTLVSGAAGQYIGEHVAEEFGIEFERDNLDDLDWLWYDIEDFAKEASDYLDELTCLDGAYYFGSHEADGSFCLFFSKNAEEVAI